MRSIQGHQEGRLLSLECRVKVDFSQANTAYDKKKDEPLRTREYSDSAW